ncbi:MAG: hypothetical protein J4F28_03900 [Nitrosopumilaceae archaeon]|nr:hypothetical protein [Nitrosopumilaceae archaeon]
MPKISDEDRERVRLLNIIAQSRGGFGQLSLDELVRLQSMIERKDYSNDKKSAKSKAAMLKKINVRIYELTEGKGIWDR